MPISDVHWEVWCHAHRYLNNLEYLRFRKSVDALAEPTTTLHKAAIHVPAHSLVQARWSNGRGKLGADFWISSERSAFNNASRNFYGTSSRSGACRRRSRVQVHLIYSTSTDLITLYVDSSFIILARSVCFDFLSPHRWNFSPPACHNYKNLRLLVRLSYNAEQCIIFELV